MEMLLFMIPLSLVELMKIQHGMRMLIFIFIFIFRLYMLLSTLAKLMKNQQCVQILTPMIRLHMLPLALNESIKIQKAFIHHHTPMQYPSNKTKSLSHIFATEL
jgi:hypothetical protein